MNKKVIIAEFYDSHSEVIYTVVEFFRKSGYDVHLWLNSLNRYNPEREPDVKVNYHISDSHLSRIFFILNFIRYIRRNRIQKVFINTAHGLQVRNFCIISVLFGYEVTGILHIAERLLKSYTQKLISLKIKKYFVLSDYILKNVKKLNIPKLNFGVFYPLVINYAIKNLKKENNDVIISIPGEISPYRKSYFGLIEFIKKNKDNIPGNVKFELLGTVRISEGKSVIEKIKEYGLNDLFILYDEYISDSEFYGRCEITDIVMPLINPDVDNYENYMKYQIAGAFNIAYIFQKPLLMHKSFEEIEDFKGISIFYDYDNLLNVLKDAEKLREKLEVCKNNYKNITRFDFETQRNNFMKIIDL